MFRFIQINFDFADAIQCLWHWKYRTLISAIGIAIGTTALIVMLSISEGARVEAEQSIKLLGVDTIRLESLSALEHNLATGLTLEDYKRLNSYLPNVSIAAFKYKPAQSILVGNKNVPADVLLVDDNWLSAEKLMVQDGRGFSQIDVTTGNQICIVGNDFHEQSNESINQIVSWAGYSCRVTGVLKETEKRIVEGSVLANIDINHSIILPLSQYSSANRTLTGITIKLNNDDINQIIQVAEDIGPFLNQYHKINDYTIYTPATLLDKYDEEQWLFNLVMGTIAGLSLIVGGIGILNVMLAKVSEQTREIGLRKALGATEYRIQTLFLSYSVLLSVIGTLLGVILGIIATVLLKTFIEWPISFSVFSLSVGPIFSILSGLVFGLYPAVRASKISPYAALRQL